MADWGFKKSVRIKNVPFYTYEWVKFKFYRNKIIYLAKLSKANYFLCFFDHNIRNMRKTWKGINEQIGGVKKKKKRNPVNFIHPNPIEVPASDLKETSNILNKYFATVGRKLASRAFAKFLRL